MSVIEFPIAYHITNRFNITELAVLRSPGRLSPRPCPRIEQSDTDSAPFITEVGKAQILLSGPGYQFWIGSEHVYRTEGGTNG